MGDPLYKDAIKNGLALGKRDDFFSSALPSKIPLAGRAYSASELAYDSMAQNLRLGLYKKFVGGEVANAAKKGYDLAPDYAKNFSTMINSMTGRGDLGRANAVAGQLNLLMYSARFMKSNIDQLILHPIGIGIGGIGSAAQKAAAVNLGRSVAATVGIMALANSLKPGSAEFDPRSSDFAKIKIGNARFDLTGGQGQYLIFLAKLFSGQTKSTTTGITLPNDATKLSSNFIRSKLSPVAGNLWDNIISKQYYNGEKPSFIGQLRELFMPIGLGNVVENLNSGMVNEAFLNGFADFFGIGATSYSPSGGTKTKSSWTDTNEADKKAFREKVGEKTFQEASLKYDRQYEEWLSKIMATSEYQNASDAMKQSAINTKKNELEKAIFREYGFKYRAPTKTREESHLLRTLNEIR
jgi:hypothetical protein